MYASRGVIYELIQAKDLAKYRQHHIYGPFMKGKDEFEREFF